MPEWLKDKPEKSEDGISTEKSSPDLSDLEMKDWPDVRDGKPY
jgi:hypothetical protein